MKLAAIVLCGGRSSRMGAAKAWLPFGPETMLARVVRIVSEACAPIVLVAAEGQDLPPLDPQLPVIVRRDRAAGRGPLEGLAVGLEAVADADAAYATSCDVPLLRADFIHRVAELLGPNEIAVPRTEGYQHPLAAVYRPRIRPVVEMLLAADRLRPVFLFAEVATREIADAELRGVDPHLDSLWNLNHPADYLAALAAAGLTAPADVLARLDRSPPAP